MGDQYVEHAFLVLQYFASARHRRPTSYRPRERKKIFFRECLEAYTEAGLRQLPNALHIQLSARILCSSNIAIIAMLIGTIAVS